MATIRYQSDVWVDIPVFLPIKKIEQENWVLESGNIWKYISAIHYKTMEILGLGTYINPDLSEVESLRWKGESSTRELLKDTHRTFELFMQWLAVWARELRLWKSISIWLYKEDIRNKNFIDGVTQATDNGRYAKWLTLEVSWDQHGTLDAKNISKLQKITSLWVGIWVEDFRETSNWDIAIWSIPQIIRWHIKPRYIKISNTVINRIKNNDVSSYVASLYQWLVRTWVQIIEYIWWAIIHSRNRMSERQTKMSDTLIEWAHIEYEPMLTLDWDIWWEELLVRFDKWLRTDIWLNQLKELWHTERLMIKMLSSAMERVKKGKRVSINIYIKDLSSQSISSIIDTLTENLDSTERNNIIFEILEEKYGIINDTFIQNIRILQEAWFRIAIDDLCISEKSDWLSIEILDSLLEAGIYPNYIKLDGKHSLSILDNSIDFSELRKIIILIWQLAAIRPTTLIVEWIQDLDHARKINELFLGIKWLDLVFQGRNINQSNFGKK